MLISHRILVGFILNFGIMFLIQFVTFPGSFVKFDGIQSTAKIIRALEIIRVEKLIPNEVL